jgi:hypothetical protein
MVVPFRLLSINSSCRAIPLRAIPPSVLFLALSALYPEHPSPQVVTSLDKMTKDQFPIFRPLTSTSLRDASRRSRRRRIPESSIPFCAIDRAYLLYSYRTPSPFHWELPPTALIPSLQLTLPRPTEQPEKSVTYRCPDYVLLHLHPLTEAPRMD